MKARQSGGAVMDAPMECSGGGAASGATCWMVMKPIHGYGQLRVASGESPRCMVAMEAGLDGRRNGRMVHLRVAGTASEKVFEMDLALGPEQCARLGAALCCLSGEAGGSGAIVR